MRHTRLVALFIAHLDAAAWSGPLIVNPARDLVAHVTLQIHTAHRMLPGSPETHLPRADLRYRRRIDPALLRLLPVK